ncbi:MAG: hypothetical protein KKF30_07605 [Proteobacteria bacterium]|nr:hypothetical protein [Pseudomonadota bacterium]MBU4470266.1 hypothetical protein [Pseudomonadota bacterium]MCG2752680.1 hypothetical protein [Desulfobacteraceae bacterium]
MNEYKALWAAVLERAIQDLDYHPKTKEYKLHYSPARYWLKNLKNKGLGSFIWVCKAIDYDPDRTRAKILDNHRLREEEALMSVAPCGTAAHLGDVSETIPDLLYESRA